MRQFAGICKKNPFRCCLNFFLLTNTCPRPITQILPKTADDCTFLESQGHLKGFYHSTFSQIKSPGGFGLTKSSYSTQKLTNLLKLQVTRLVDLGFFTQKLLCENSPFYAILILGCCHLRVLAFLQLRRLGTRTEKNNEHNNLLWRHHEQNHKLKKKI